MKNLIKKTLSILLAMVTCISMVITTFAAIPEPDYYEGTYYLIVGDRDAWINISDGTCQVHIVYSQDRNKYIIASTDRYYIGHTYFNAEFDEYTITDSDGNIGEHKQQTANIFGVVDETNGAIEISINGMIYQRS